MNRDTAPRLWSGRPALNPAALDGQTDGEGVIEAIEVQTIGSVGEICLGADGPLRAAVNYDNLVITNE